MNIYICMCISLRPDLTIKTYPLEDQDIEEEERKMLPRNEATKETSHLLVEGQAKDAFACPFWLFCCGHGVLIWW